MVVDGELFDGKRVKYLTKDAILAQHYMREVQGLKNWIDSYRGEIDGFKHELSVTKAQHAAEIHRLNANVAYHEGQLARMHTQLAEAKSAETRARRLENFTAKQLASELRARIGRRVARWMRGTTPKRPDQAGHG
jgi:hypothetical protein